MAKPIPSYIIKAELKDFRSPATWRRFKIKKNLPITELAYYLEIMFEMYAEHQYDFTYQSDDGLVVMVNNPEEYSMVPSFPGGPKIKYVGLNDFRLNYFNVGDEFLFRYDFGDGWEIKLKIEQLDDQNELSAKNLPRIIAGKGFGIVENVGGVDALKEFGHDLKRSDDQLNDFGTMLPEPLFDVADVFTLNYYNQDELNWRLKRLIRYYRQAYDGIEISNHAIDLIERYYPEFKLSQDLLDFRLLSSDYERD